MIQNEKNRDIPAVNWLEIISKYNFPDPGKSWWQVINSVIPYLGLWVLMYFSLGISYWLTLLLSVFAVGFLVRIFIIFHDCGHHSFFKSPWLNRLVGIPLGLLVFTPYHRWHRDHKKHHDTVGNLDKRGVGDVKTLTVEEYNQRSKWGRFAYRFYRNPLFLIAIAPLLLFLIQHRLPKTYMNPSQHIYLQLSNLAIAGVILLLGFTIGFKAFILIQLPIIYLASVIGVWLFYVQHQFEDVVWERAGDWDHNRLSIEGSSFFKLPKVLQWFTGNIGFHHIHHLSPRIPNYKLPLCHFENPVFNQIKPITLRSSIRSAALRLWDEQNRRLISFSQWKQMGNL
jgi:acyl-lipid omega-6 desaturase (Delta-12 desaturase)